MKQGYIYLQYGFWKAVKELYANVFGPNGWDIFCVLRTIKAKIEIPIEAFGQDDYLSMLWHESGGSCVVEKGQIDKILSEKILSIEELCSVFLLDKTETECNMLSNGKGIFCLNAEMLSRKRYLLSDKKISFDYLQEGNYYCIKDSFSHPCNSLILIDPYLLVDSKNIHNHLKHLLKNILPQTSEFTFDLSIFSGIGKCNYDNKELGEKFFEEIETMLNEIRPCLDISFTMYQIPAQGEGWHDRYILTNSLIIEATSGFDVFGPIHGKIKAKKDCIFNIYHPIFNKSGAAITYNKFIKKTTLESQKEERYQHRRFGTEVNRLFDLIQ